MISRTLPLCLCSCSTSCSSLPPTFISRGIKSTCRPNTYSAGDGALPSPPRYIAGTLRSLFNRRAYAAVSDSASKRMSESPGQGWPSSARPTPYEIIGQPRQAPYSKARFYELVKVYHPDRHHLTDDGGLSRAVRLERYRLIVHANEILSDPAKRRTYDQCGGGWGVSPSTGNSYRAPNKDWRKEPGNPSMNATWEDWERWYQARDGGERKQQRQGPVYMSNPTFAAMLCAFVVVGSMGQARRVENRRKTADEVRERESLAISEDLRRRSIERAVHDRRERVEVFRRRKDGWEIAVAATTGHHGENGQHSGTVGPTFASPGKSSKDLPGADHGLK
ncbi:hypothetical protein GGR56DRAFT_524593 [Xylariaceae sp. FL0804]|nr:hypothetical protein GGR56DRAFT_524593 [Xylariaceae sp. FL0804]